MKNQVSFAMVVGGTMVLGAFATGCSKAQPAAQQTAPASDPAKGAEPSPVTSAVNAIMAENQSPSDRWVSAMRPAMGDQLCKSGGYFRECFTVTNDECRALTLKHFNQCLSQPGAIPSEVNAESGERAGKILGSCTGSTYEIELTKVGKALKNARCADPRNWVP